MARNRRPGGPLYGREGRSANPDTRESFDPENLTPPQSFDPETLTPPQSEVPAEEPEDEFVGPPDTRSDLQKALDDAFGDRFKVEDLSEQQMRQIQQLLNANLREGAGTEELVEMIQRDPSMFGLEPRRFSRQHGRSSMDVMREQAAATAYEQMRRDNPRLGALREEGDDPNAGFPRNVMSSVLDMTGLVPKPTADEQRERNQRFREYQLRRGELQGYDDDRYPIHKSAYDIAAENYPDLFSKNGTIDSPSLIDNPHFPHGGNTRDLLHRHSDGEPQYKREPHRPDEGDPQYMPAKSKK